LEVKLRKEEKERNDYKKEIFQLENELEKLKKKHQDTIDKGLSNQKRVV